MTDMLSIGASGVRAYQTALSTTSDNIANAATPGYSRRSASISEVTRAISVQLGQTAVLNGNGSYIDGIARASDGFKVAEVRTSGADLARTETGIVWLDRIEGALTGNQLGQRLTAFFNAAKGIAADPAASAPRAVMLESGASVAAAFGGTGRAVDAAAADIAGNGEDAARSLSDAAGSLFRINAQLARSDERSNSHAQLLDERDRILESMSALVDVDVKTDSLGRATVRVGGAAGPVLVDHDSAGNVSFAANGDGSVSFAVRRNGGMEVIPAHGGALAGIADGAIKVAAAREAIDDLATRFVAALNSFQGAGRDLDGVAGPAMFAVGAKPTDISLTLTDPRKIAAAATGEGVRGNGNLANLALTRTSGAFEAGLDDVTTANAAALAARRNVAEAQTSIHGAAVAARDSVSGVDLDEEAVNLIRFQQAYQASSRCIQVAREILQTIIDIR